MSTLVAKPRISDWLKSEAPSRLSREEFTVLSGQTLKAGQVCCTDAATGKKKAVPYTGNETHTYTLTGTPTSGTFTLTLWHKDGYWVTIGPLAYNASQATVDAAIEAALGGTVTTTVTGGGTAITAIAIAFSTGYTSTVWPTGQLDWSGLSGITAVTITRSTSAGAARDEVQTITLSGAMTAGTYALTIFAPDGTPLSIDVAWNTDWATTMAAINVAITAAATAWAGTASAGAVMTGTATAQVLTFSGVGFTGKVIPRLAIVETNAITGATSASIAQTTSGGKAGERAPAADSISVADVDASSGDVADAVFIVRDALVNGDELYWGGCDPTGGAAGLKLQGIIVRNSPAIQNHSA